MKPRAITLAKILTYSGTLPLIGCVVLMYAPVVGVDGALIARTYSAIIISFLCGIHWAIYIFFAEKCMSNLLITSNLLALLAWSSLLIAHQDIALILQSACFLYLLMLDLKLRDAGILPDWFYYLRRNATAIVILCLASLVGWA